MLVSICGARLNHAKTIADFNSRLAVQTEGRPLDAALINPAMDATRLESGNCRCRIAKLDGKAVDQITATSEWCAGQLWRIQCVYVHEEYRHKGMFPALDRQAGSLARQDPEVCGLHLYAGEDNKRAQETHYQLAMLLPGYRVMEGDFPNDPQ